MAESGAARPAGEPRAIRIPLWELFTIFFKAGLAFGGGLAILAVLEEELVRKRGALTRQEFLAIYGIGRIVPSGTSTALAVAYGSRFGGFPGTLVTLTGLVLPAFVITVSLTALYQLIRDTPLFGALESTVIPAALALIVVATLRLARVLREERRGVVLALGAFTGLYLFGVNPAVLLLLGGFASIALFHGTERVATPTPTPAATPEDPAR